MRVYEVKIGGIPHTMQLDERDAERYGAVEPKATKPSRKAPAKKPVETGDGSD